MNQPFRPLKLAAQGNHSMSIKRIRGLYEGRLAGWAASRSIPVAWQNVDFTPPSTIYLRAFMIPAETSGLDIAGESRTYKGVFQISVVAPEGSGPGQAEQIASDLDGLFPLALLLDDEGFSVQITHPCSQAPSIHGGGRYTVPVSFRYRADT